MRPASGQGSGLLKAIRSNKRAMVLSLIFFVFATGAILARRAETAGRAAGGGPGSQAGSARSGNAQLVRIFAHGEDIYPPVIYARPGKILITAENETQSDITIVLQRVGTGLGLNSVGTVSTDRKSKRARQEFTLGAGEYAFYEEAQPDFKGLLIVRP
jgi:hypothetical protein